MELDGNDDIYYGVDYLGQPAYMAKVAATGVGLWGYVVGALGGQLTSMQASGNGYATYTDYDTMGGSLFNSSARLIAPGGNTAVYHYAQCNTAQDCYGFDGSATDNLGNLYELVNILAPADFGGGLIGPGHYLVKYSVNGTYQYDRPFSADVMRGDAVGNLAFGGTTAANNGLCNVPPNTSYVGQLDGNGNCAWVNAFSGTLDDIQIALSTAGEIYAAGLLTGTANLGGGVIGTAGQKSVAIVKLDSMGNHLWSTAVGNATTAGLSQLRLSPAGADTVLASLRISGTVDFGQGPLTASPGLALVKVTGGSAVASMHTDHPDMMAAGDSQGNAVIVTQGRDLMGGCQASITSQMSFTIAVFNVLM